MRITAYHRNISNIHLQSYQLNRDKNESNDTMLKLRIERIVMDSDIKILGIIQHKQMKRKYQ